jgi:mRNA-degrading endonuclease RelE of RelBE toxin-antitoxin system
VIPRSLCEDLHLREGDFVTFSRQPGGVLIKPKKMVDPDDVLTPEEGARVKKAAKEIRQEVRDAYRITRQRILDYMTALDTDPFQGLVKALKGTYKGLYGKVSGRYRIIFRPIHATHIVEVLNILIRNEATYR